jgi:hypothetical protein
MANLSPRTVRNFWVTGSADGRATGIAFGPNTGINAGIVLTIFQRDKGQVVKAFEVFGRMTKDGKLKLTVTRETGGAPLENITER